VNSILLHPLRLQVDLLHKEGHQRNVVLLCQARIDRAKRFRITTSIISRQTNLHQQRLRFRGFHFVDHFGQIRGDILRRETTQAIVTAQFD